MAAGGRAGGRGLGLVTLEDVLEELVGEIRDAAHHERVRVAVGTAGPLDRVRFPSDRQDLAGDRVRRAARPASGPCPTSSVWCGSPACPLFLWLVLGPEADGMALAVLMVAGVTDFLDG